MLDACAASRSSSHVNSADPLPASYQRSGCGARSSCGQPAPAGATVDEPEAESDRDGTLTGDQRPPHDRVRWRSERLRQTYEDPATTMDATPRFLTNDDVAEILNISTTQVYALVRRGELRAIKIGQRGQWRVEASALEEFIQNRYEATKRFIAEHPMGVNENEAAELVADDRDG